MNWNLNIIQLMLVATLAIALSGCQESRPTNIILIMADDLGYETIGANGSLSYQTPALDRLASTGMRFTHAFSTPLCTPSRVQIMTGLYSHRNYTAFGMLDPDETTFAHALQDAGYATLAVGKWQLFGNSYQRDLFGSVGTYPSDAGFDEYCLWQIDEVGGSRYKDPFMYVSGQEPQTYEGSYGPDMAVSMIGDFIERNADRPFFVYYPMILPHSPFQPVPGSADYATFDAENGGSSTDYFADHVAYMDTLVGRIVGHLDANNLRGNTLLIFIGDNGTDRAITSQHDSGEIRGRKGYPTAAGTHVPMIVSWPEEIEEGVVNDNLIDFTDFFPTFLDVAGQSAADGQNLDGLSFLGQLTGESTTVRSWVYGDYAPRWGPFNNRRLRYIHDREWKLYDDSLFFNHASDPTESHPVPDSVLTAAQIELKRQFQTEMDALR